MFKMIEDKIKAAIEHLKKGKLIIVVDDDTREAEGDLVGIANLVTPEAVNFMTRFARGLICTPMSVTSANRLRLSEMVQNNSDHYGTAFTNSVDYIGNSTGISAFDRAQTILNLSKVDSVNEDFNQPGHMFPLIAKKGGVMERRGHTEAAVDLAKLTNESEVAYICEILNVDGTMARRPQLDSLARHWKMPIISVEELVIYFLNQNKIKVNLPTKYGNFELTLFEDEASKEHLMLSKGDLSNFSEPLLVRLHSECLTGDIFGSHRCDCGEQLAKSMKMIEENGTGAILYLRQEGRGIGLKNKLKAYQLQENGKDTLEANTALGFRPDEREYGFAADILKSFNICEVKLMTNNPDKVKQLEENGIKVYERISIEVESRTENKSYLKTKKEKFNHILSI
ncbi:GTP cyclohydrolase II [Listeria booriae]|nr:GTP cyclohydrolase II [Listeria booriae]